MQKKTSSVADSNNHEPRLYRVVANRIQDLIRDELAGRVLLPWTRRTPAGSQPPLATEAASA